MRGPSGARFARGALLVLFTYIFLANQWMGNNAHITFRSVWNFVHGYGLTPDERVQAYTHPLWMMAISVSHLLTGDVFFTVTALSWIFEHGRRGRPVAPHGDGRFGRASDAVASQLQGARQLHVVRAWNIP